ncbi:MULTISPECIES: YebO family protein [unclassified Brenneria]|uniref:YebO family protein n=1 Tax=unclassified Brenneria TaxID=2634434 RepID=UPI0029C1A496|nr:MULTISPECIES: YebO family protein [unclassified Brenneria]MDX5626719.1 YebO family protein [Brenneria sp. L3-3Z]MDX5693931.1 YebO family protein [Brenneria sp. L4-2C]
MNGLGVNTLEMLFAVLVALLVLLVWFFINRASVRANEQIRLLREIVEQQRQQLELLKRLAPQQQTSEAAEKSPEQDDVALDFKDIIPER